MFIYTTTSGNAAGEEYGRSGQSRASYDGTKTASTFVAIPDRFRSCVAITHRCLELGHVMP